MPTHKINAQTSPPGTRRRARWLPTKAETSAYVMGILLLTVWLAEVWQSEARAAEAIAMLADTSQWSESRRRRFLEASKAAPDDALGALRIPRLALTVPVYRSASELHLDLGAGVIDGMAYPHEGGHIGIAGHRDGYFRALKDLVVGDVLQLETLEGPKRFRVEELLVVAPERTDLLQDTREQRLTLVTCYPFYFVGDAPQRLLVRASPVTSRSAITPNPHSSPGANS